MDDTNKSKSNENFNILFWNFRSIQARKFELEKVNLDFDIIVGVETWLNKDSLISFTGHNIHRVDRPNAAGGGIIFIVKSDIDFQILDIVSPVPEVELGGIKVNSNNHSFNIIACYKPPHIHPHKKYWDQIMSNQLISNDSSILVGDFNAHHLSWNCDRNDNDGKNLLNALDANNLMIHNLNTLTHIDVARKKKSNIDLIISTPSLADLIDFKVFDDPLGSDHFPINIKVNIQRFLYQRKSFKLHSKRTDWAKCCELLEEGYSEFFSPDYLNANATEKYKFWCEKVTSAVKASTPKRKTVQASRFLNPVPWWDAECYKLKRLRKAAYKKWDFSGSPIDHQAYLKADKILRKTFKKKKKVSYRIFAETIDFNKNSSYVWKKTKVFKNKWVKTTSPNYDKAKHRAQSNIVLQKIAPHRTADVTINPEPDLPNSKDSFFDDLFDFYEFNAALESRNKHSGCGLDGIDYFTILTIPIKYRLELLDIYNHMHATNEYPLSWQESYVHFISKADGSGLRPIAMTSCLCKLYELMVKNRLQWFCEHNEILPISNSGFRKGRSCNDNLINLALYVEDGFLNNKDTLAAFLDVQGAFDNVDPKILLKKLEKIGCSKTILKFVQHLTFQRFIYTEYNMDKPRYAYKGVPQGGVLSPLLYLIYVANISDGLSKLVQISQFADDIALYTNVLPFSKSKNLLEKGVESIRINLLNLGLVLSLKKTKLIHFNKKNIAPGDTYITVDGQKIRSVEFQNHQNQL